MNYNGLWNDARTSEDAKGLWQLDTRPLSHGRLHWKKRRKLPNKRRRC